MIGAEAMRTMGAHGVVGDLLFVAAGSFFAMFGMLVRLWRVPAMSAAAITSVLSLVGPADPAVQFGQFAGLELSRKPDASGRPGRVSPAPAPPSFSPARSCSSVLGRAALFPSLVPPFMLLIGFLALGVVPSVSQLIGLVVVVIGFQLTQQN